MRVLDFGAEILIDRPVVNALGEREIKLWKRLVADAEPMRVLYEACARALEEGALRPCPGAGLEETGRTMDPYFSRRGGSPPCTNGRETVEKTDICPPRPNWQSMEGIPCGPSPGWTTSPPARRRSERSWR